jgi:hypothetical protein
MRVVLGAISLVFCAAPTAAQIEAALDLAYTHDFVWRGLTRVSRPSVQPAFAVGWKTPSLLVSGGVWALMEPWRARPGDLSLAGEDTRWGEADLWLQGDYVVRILSFNIETRAGLVRYTFPGSDPNRSLSTDHSELYAGLRITGLENLYSVIGLPADLPVGIEAGTAFDLGGVGGTYLEAGLVADLPVLFIGEPLGSVDLRLTSAWSWNQEASAPEGGYYEGEGLTHMTLAAGVTPFFHLGPVPATLHLGGTVQYNVDAATRIRGPLADDRSRWIGWMDVTVSMLFPLRRKP